MSGNDDTTDVLRGGQGTDTLVLKTPVVTLAGLNAKASIEFVNGYSGDSGGKSAIVGTEKANVFDFQDMGLNDVSMVSGGDGGDRIIGSADDNALKGDDGNGRHSGRRR